MGCGGNSPAQDTDEIDRKCLVTQTLATEVHVSSSSEVDLPLAARRLDRSKGLFANR